MKKGLAIAGGALMLASIFGLVFSIAGIASHGPDDDNIIHDTESDGTSFTYDGEVILLEVYAKGDVDCYNYNIIVTDGEFDYFYPDCESGIEVNGYTYLGDLELSESGAYTIEADGELVIVDADGLLGPIFLMCGGGFCCLLGIILLIIGLATGQKVPQVVVFQQPDGTILQANQTTVQQYIPPSNTVNQVTTMTQPIQQEIPAEPSDFEPFSFEHKKQP